MSETTQRNFDEIEKDTEKFQEERYMDSLMGSSVGRNDKKSQKRREEAREYDAHLEKINQRGNGPVGFNDSIIEADPIQKKIDFLSKQILEIEATYKDKNSVESNRLSTVVEKDLASKKAMRSNLIAQLQKESDVLLGKSDHPVIEPSKVADLKQNIEDETDTVVLELDAPTADNPSEDPKPHDIPSQPGEAIVTPVNVTTISSEKAPKDPTERKKWRTRLLAAGALVAAGAILSWVAISGGKDSNKDNQRSVSDDNKAGQTNPSSPNVQNDSDQRLKDIGLRYNRFDPHLRDRMSTGGAFDKTERNMAELDDHVLAKIKNNPSLMSAVLEVRESGNKDANFSLADVNNNTREFSVRGEHGKYAAKGEKAVDTLERSWDRGHQGKLLSKGEVKKLMDKYVFINHGTDGGNFKNAIDDKVYDAGIFDYRPELGDEIYAKKLGNGETVYFKVNEKDPTRDCLNVQTLREKGASTPAPETGGSTPTEQTDEFIGELEGPEKENPETKLDPKNPDEDSNKSRGDLDGTQFPSGDQKPATQPGPTYTPPAPPEAPVTPRPEAPPTSETGTPTQNNPGNGTVTQP